MARNKYPEKSKELILEVSKKLFVEKGFDRTSIQDIINQLGGMTKGVIYHHFKSKMDILNAIIGVNDEKLLTEEWIGNNGLEKLQYILVKSLSDYKKFSTLYTMKISLKSPSILFEQYNVSYNFLIPKINEIIHLGIMDGSIKTNFPEETAEIIVMYFNLIIGLRITELTQQELIRKFEFIRNMLKVLNVPVISDEIFSDMIELAKYISTTKNKLLKSLFFYTFTY